MLIGIFVACDDFKKLERQTLVRTGEVQSLAYNQAQVKGEIVDLAVGDSLQGHGHCWDTLSQPIIRTEFFTELGERQNTGAFVSDLPSLLSNQVYYVRAYFIIRGDTLYSPQISFQTPSNPNLPFLLSLAAINISTQQAQVQSRFERVGTFALVRYGHCWSTSPNPELSDFNDDLGNNPTSDIILSTLTGLQADTEYFARAYCQVDENGILTTVYSQSIRFRTARE